MQGESVRGCDTGIFPVSCDEKCAGRNAGTCGSERDETAAKMVCESVYGLSWTTGKGFLFDRLFPNYSLGVSVYNRIFFVSYFSKKELAPPV